MCKPMHILSIFLCVLILSAVCLQPVAYANAAVVAGGEAANLFIAALLSAMGIKFDSAQQAENMAKYVFDTLPKNYADWIAEDIVKFGIQNVKTYQAFEKGLTQSVTVARDMYDGIKSWVYDKFGINQAAVDAGVLDLIPSGFTGGTVNIEHSDGTFATYPVYSDEVRSDISLYSPLPSRNTSLINGNVNSSSSSYNFKYFLYDKYSTSYLHLIDQQVSGVVHKLSFRNYVISTNVQKGYDNISLNSLDSSYPAKIIFYQRSDGMLSIGYAYYSDGVLKYSFKQMGYPNNLYSDSKVNLESSAYAHTIPAEQTEIPIALPADISGLMNQAWGDILNDYGLDTWDFKESLEKMREQLEKNKDVLNGLGWEALSNNVISLELEIARLQDLIAAQGVDVIGGVGSLNDAMVDAGLVISGLERTIAQSQAATDAQISDLASELEKAREEIAKLTKEKETEIPDEKPDIKKGSINWKILLGLAIFDKFPFSLPKDVYLFFTILAAPPKEPVFVFDIFGGKFGEAGIITLDFKQFEDIRQIARTCILIMLVVGLIGATKTYIWSGGG